MKIKVTHIIFTLFFLFTAFSSIAQTLDPSLCHDLKKKYRNNKPPGEKQSRVEFIDADSLWAATGVEIMQIIIIRHQKVSLTCSGKYMYSEMGNYFASYDTARVVPIVHNSVQLKPNEVQEIYTSTLSRSIQTAELLFGNDILFRSKDLFNEYKKHVPVIRGVELGCATWKGLSTISWILGFGKNNGESYSEAKVRASLAADFLEINASYKGKVILVGHGFINHHIKKYLKKKGWKMILNGESKNLGITLLIKER